MIIKETLNTRRLLCPLPVIRTQDKVKHLQQGDILEVVGTDPGIMQDIPAWCRINGHRVVDSYNDAFDYFVVIEVGHGK
jgi:TusA-related sulfurtransferase